MSWNSLAGFWGNKGWHSKEADEAVGAPREGWTSRRFYPGNASVLVGINLAKGWKKRTQRGESTDFIPGNADVLVGIILANAWKKRTQRGQSKDFFPGNADVLVGIILVNGWKKRTQRGESTDFIPGNASVLVGIILVNGWKKRTQRGESTDFIPGNASVLVGIILANAWKKRTQRGESTDFIPGNADVLVGLVLSSPDWETEDLKDRKQGVFQGEEDENGNGYHSTVDSSSQPASPRASSFVPRIWTKKETSESSLPLIGVLISRRGEGVRKQPLDSSLRSLLSFF